MAKFSDVDGLPRKQGSKASWGTVMHHALEFYNRTGDIDYAIRLFLECWDDPSILHVEVDVWNRYTTFGGLRQRGMEILRAYHERIRLEDRTVIAAEHRFLVPFGRHEITGTVDLIELKRNHRGNDLLAISDYKGNGRRPTTATLALDIQFTSYLYASTQPEFWTGNGEGFPPIVNHEWWWETLADVPRRGIWIQLMDNGREMDAGARDQDDFGRLHRLIDEIERAIEYQVFVPSIGEACGLCDYANGPCPVKVPTRDEWDARVDTDDSAWLP